MSNPEVEDRLQFALAASQAAAELVMSHFQQASLHVDWKSDLSPVTAADRGAEELLRAELLRQFPDDSVLGEEFGETAGRSRYRWVLDPVDGTKSFIHGTPLFGMLIGLQEDQAPAAGIVRMPALNEVAYARRGGGAWWSRNGREAAPARVTTQTQLEESLFCFTAPEGFLQIERWDVLEEFSRRCRLSRGWGDCYGHLLVATGRADLMIDPLLAEWDAAALIPLVEEAGGVFADWSGVSTARGGNGISTTPGLSKAVWRLLTKAPAGGRPRTAEEPAT